MAKRERSPDSFDSEIDGTEPTPPNALVPTISDDEAEELGLQTSKDALDGEHFTKQLTLPPGIPLKARFAGYAGKMKVEDQNKPGKKRWVHLWLFKVSEGLTYKVIGGYEMNQTLPNYPIGDRITIVLAAEKGRSRKGNQVNDYAISDPKSGFLREPHVVLEDLDGDKGNAS